MQHEADEQENAKTAKGQAHHMFSRILSLWIGIRIFFTTGRFSADIIVCHNRKEHWKDFEK